MNEKDRKYDWLKHLRNFGLVNENINIAFLIILWVLKFKVVFWIFLAMTILDWLITGYHRAKIIRELRLI